MTAQTTTRQDHLNAAFRAAIVECQRLTARQAARPAAERLTARRFASVIRSTVTLTLEGHGYRYDELWTGVDTVMNGLRRTGRI
jgi:hypothetical protein